MTEGVDEKEHPSLDPLIDADDDDHETMKEEWRVDLLLLRLRLHFLLQDERITRKWDTLLDS
jgi:hypothetical protein